MNERLYNLSESYIPYLKYLGTSLTKIIHIISIFIKLLFGRVSMVSNGINKCLRIGISFQFRI